MNDGDDRLVDSDRRFAAVTAELEASRELLKGTIDSSDDMIQVFEAVRDKTGGIVDFRWILNNRTSEQRFGDVRGESLLEQNPGVISEGIFDTFKRVTETGVGEQTEHHYVHEQFDGWFFQSVVKLGDGVATTTKAIDQWKAAQAKILRLQQETSQARLSESEQRYRTLFNSIDQGFCTIKVKFDDEGRPLDYCFVEVSPSFERQTGIENGAGRWMREIAPDQDQSWFDLYGRVARSGEPARFEDYSTPLDRWFAVYAFPIEAEDHIGVLFHDITERKRHETALHEASERFRALATAGNQSIYRMSPDWRVMYALDSDTLAATDAPIEDWIDKYILEDDRPEVRAAIDRAIRTKSVFELEHRVRAEDGGIGWVHSRAVPILKSDGEITEWFGAASDVTDRKRSEEALASSEARLRLALEAGQIGEWELDLTTDTAVRAARHDRIFGYDEPIDDWGFETFIRHVVPEDRADVEAGFQTAAETGAGWDFECRIRRANDGEVRWIKAHSAPQVDEMGTRYA